MKVKLIVGFQNTEYRQLLIHSIHQCAIKFSEVAASVVDLLMYVKSKSDTLLRDTTPESQDIFGEQRLLLKIRFSFRLRKFAFKKQV